MARKSDIISVSFPKKLSKDLKRAAKAEGRTQSEILRNAFRYRQWSNRFDALQREGRRVADEFGITSEDDIVALVREVRKERRRA